MEIVDQQVALVQARDKTCMWAIMDNINTIIVVVGCIWTAQAAVHNKDSSFPQTDVLSQSVGTSVYTLANTILTKHIC